MYVIEENHSVPFLCYKQATNKSRFRSVSEPVPTPRLHFSEVLAAAAPETYSSIKHDNSEKWETLVNSYLGKNKFFFSLFCSQPHTKDSYLKKQKKRWKKKYTARRLRPRDLRVKHKQQTVKHVCCESVRVMKSLAALAARKSHSAHAEVLALHVLPRRHRASFIFTCRHASRLSTPSHGANACISHILL